MYETLYQKLLAEKNYAGMGMDAGFLENKVATSTNPLYRAAYDAYLANQAEEEAAAKGPPTKRFKTGN